MSRFNVATAEKMAAFYKSETWRIIKHRLFIFKDRLEETALNDLKLGNLAKASDHASMAQGVIDTIRVTEHLSSEIMNEKFDVDAVLHVIGNNATIKNKEKRSWLKKKLSYLKKTK